jgi:hypothetical protein
MESKIVNVLWFSHAYEPWHFGIVKVKTRMGKIEHYIGSAKGLEKKRDAENIAHWGARINIDMVKEFLLDEDPESLRSKEIRDPTANGS